MVAETLPLHATVDCTAALPNESQQPITAAQTYLFLSLALWHPKLEKGDLPISIRKHRETKGPFIFCGF